QIRWPDSGRLVEVCSREAVQDRVSRRLAQCRAAAPAQGSLTAVERRTLGWFLRSAHWPGSDMELH
ncbi:MAG: hypothetical protein ABIR55_06225, partial [Burkholderiaceae bacterium]